MDKQTVDMIQELPLDSLILIIHMSILLLMVVS
jgi:hypothetical protein